MNIVLVLMMMMMVGVVVGVESHLPPVEEREVARRGQGVNAE